jgi:hypothetical protein
MNIKDFNEALYASSNGVIVERRKSVVVPIIILLVGVAMLVANAFLPDNPEMNNLKSTIVLVGGLVTLVGAIYTAITIFGRGVPYHKEEQCFLLNKKYSFERALQSKVVAAVEKCDKIALDALEESDVAGVTVVCYYSPKSNYCIMQAFAYDDFTYQSITKLYEKA